MSEEQAQSRLWQLQAIDPALLQEVVRQDQNSRDFQVTDWSVDHLSNTGMISGENLFLFCGQGADGRGPQSWSVVLKTPQAPAEEQDPSATWYWKRELLLAQSGLLAGLAGPLLAPRIYGSTDYGTTGWIWMEHLVDTSPARWTLDQYRFAARQIGRANGAYLTGTPIPDFPWLVQEHTRGFANGGNWLEPLGSMDNPSVTGALGEVLIGRLLQLWDERERFFNTLICLPQVFSQGDVQRGNLFVRRRDGRDDLIAVDWEMCGRVPIGEDMWALIASSALLRHWEPDDIGALEAAAYPAYLAGLQEAGWSGDPALVRLGFTASTAMSMGSMMPFAIDWFGKEEMREFDLRKFGHPPEELIRGFVMLEAYALERADEARRIMDRLGWG
jgi:hypothetical protein